MTRTLRAALAGCAALALVSGLAAGPAFAEANPAAWPQAHSDIKADPAARFGQLPNGMRYVLMHNATPPHQTSIRLRIGSGSLEEADDQQGLAHFLEHMAFKGSTHVPEGEMVKLLQRHGLAFGPDTNAFTSFGQTVYMLDLPESDEDSLNLGLMLMRETASELNLDAKAMEPERGVVLSEERLRDTPAYEASLAQQTFLMKGQLPPTRWPIGKVDVIRNAPAQRLRDFYQANYRPERATLVMVGDFDVDAMEAKVKARFADWKGVGAATKEPDIGPVAARGLSAQVIVQPGATMSVSVTWARPHDPSPDSRAKEARDTVEALGMNVINRRMERLARGDAPPFLSAGVAAGDELKAVKIGSLGVNPKGDDWRGGLIAADVVRRQALQYGVQPDELARAITETRTQLQSAIDGASTRRTPNLAQQIIADLDAPEVLASPQENLSIFEQAVKGLTPAQVDTAIRAAFSGAGPLISMITPTPLEGGEAALIDGFKAAEAAPVAEARIIQKKPWPYTSFGPAGRVTETRDVPDLGVSFVRFANGTRLTFKHTGYRKDQVEIAFDLPGGILTLPKDKTSAIWASGALTQGGMGRISLEDTEQALAGKVYNFNARVGEKDFVLAGRTKPENLDTELQLMTAYMTDPGWRPAALERARAIANLQLDQLDSTPAGVLARHLETLLHSGDARWVNPTRADVKAATLADIRSLWDRALAGPVDVTIIGDITLEQAEAAVAATVGALPARGPAAPLTPGADKVRFPAQTAQPVKLTHKGRADQAIAYIAWPANDFYADPQETRALSLAVAVLQDRLIQKVRIAEGATYSPTAALRASETFPGYGVVSSSVETPPAKLASFFQNVEEIAAGLRDKPISADDLERARKPRIEQIEKSKETNEYWLGRLQGAIDDKRRLDVIRETVAGYRAVTAEDIQAAARKYLRPDTAYKIEVVPEAKPAAPAKP